ncbi:MAG TPA: hypothetical protein VIZ62_08960 [Nitrososphaeraceae archaeon]
MPVVRTISCKSIASLLFEITYNGFALRAISFLPSVHALERFSLPFP